MSWSWMPGKAWQILSLSTVVACPAFGQFGPVLTNAYTSSPGGITIAWFHGGPGVDYYFADIRPAKLSGPISRSSAISKDSRNYTFLGLKPATAYEVRVCADYNRTLECSHADGDPWQVVETMGPERRPTTSNGAPPPRPVPPPVLTSAATRERDTGPIVVGLRNTALRTLQPADRAQVLKQTWWRGEQSLGENWSEVMMDRDPPSWTTYKVCFELTSGGWSCSSVRAGYLGTAMSFTNVGYGAYVSHKDFFGHLEESVAREEEQTRASFLLRPGLVPAAGGVSFEIVGMPRYYFVQAAGLRVMPDDGTEDFHRRATFQVIVPAIGYSGRTDIVNFESVSQRGTYLWANGTNLVLGAPSNFGDRPWTTVAAFQFQPALVQPPGMQVRDISRMRVIDTQMPLMVKRHSIGKRTSPPLPPSPPLDPCVAYERAVAKGSSRAVVSALQQRCMESKNKD